MKTQLIREEFLKVVSIANRFVPVRPSIPVLANLLLKASKTGLEVSATNLESSVSLFLPARSDGDWEITAPAKIVNDFVSSAIDKEIVLEADKESLTISSGEFRGTLSGISATEFPTLQESKAEPLEFDLNDLQDSVESVAFAASLDEAKPILTGIFISQEGEATIIVATDGYRLAKKTLTKKYPFNQVIIPSRTLVEALRVASEMNEPKVQIILSASENQLILKGSAFQIGSRLLDGTYPAFQQIIPTKFVNELTVEKDRLVSAIKATAVFARDIGNVVKIEVSGRSLSLSANTAQVGEGSAHLTTDSKGENIKIAFNSRYLLEGLANLKTQMVEFKFSGSLSPAVLVGQGDKNFLYIVMPVKSQS